MTEPALVSVIIPCFNYSRYLGAAIESALAQTHGALDVLVIDDGSTDDTREVAQRYPVRLISQPNSGLSVSTSRGVREALGEFVVRLDADDVLYPTFVEKTLGALEQVPDAVLASADAEYFGARTGRVRFGPCELEALAQGAYATGTALYRKSAWNLIGGIDEHMRLCEDWDLWLRFAERGMAGLNVDEVLWGYRQHGRSMINRSIRSWRDVRREYRLIAALQDNHPSVFAPHHLCRRLLHAPGRVRSGAMPPRWAVRLLLFYGVMLLRVVAGAHTGLPRAIAAATPDAEA